MIVALITGLSTGFGLFYRLLYILGITGILLFIWNLYSISGLEVTVDRRSRRVRVGDDVEERITVRNRGTLPKPELELEDPSDLPGYHNGVAASLPSRGFRSFLTRTPARKRGAYTLGPVRVSNTDAFGLFRRERYFGGTDTLIVYPQVFDIPSFNISAAYLTGDTTTRKRSHDLTPHASSVREYAFGDSISRVHWNSTARLGKLMSKDFDLGVSSDVWLVVDLHRDVQAGSLEESTDEYAVSIAASLAQKYLRMDLPVGLMAYGDRRYFLSADSGAGQFDRIMEYLAMSKAEGTVPLESLVAREEQLWGNQSTVILVTPSNRLEWTIAARELTRRRVRLSAVLLDGVSFGGYLNTLDVIPGLFDAGIEPYVVNKGDNIPLALGYTYVSPERAESGHIVEGTEARI